MECQRWFGQRALVLALTLGTAACAATSSETTMRIDELGDGTEIAVRPGQALEIALVENPSTGYSWKLLSDGAPVLRLESDRYQAPQTQLAGAPGRHTWVIRVAVAGEATVELAYSRPWETVEPIRRFTLRVKSQGQ
jgi:inhibitor of cysteine peptidase